MPEDREYNRGGDGRALEFSRLLLSDGFWADWEWRLTGGAILNTVGQLTTQKRMLGLAFS